MRVIMLAEREWSGFSATVAPEDTWGVPCWLRGEKQPEYHRARAAIGLPLIQTDQPDGCPRRPSWAEMKMSKASRARPGEGIGVGC